MSLNIIQWIMIITIQKWYISYKQLGFNIPKYLHLWIVN